MRVVLAGGGTAGHINPLLATAAELRQRFGNEAKLLVLGTTEGLEAKLVPAAGLELLTVPKVPFPRAISGQALLFPARFRSAVRQTRTAIESFDPDVVVGFGGYVAPPAYLAAHRLDIPLVIHEANARAGLANQLGARYAQVVATTFPGSKLAKAQVTGLPMRSALAKLDRLEARASAREALGLDADKPCLLVAGGSLGALHLNQALADLAEPLLASGAQVLHLTGKGKAEVLAETLSRVNGTGHYHLLEYLDQMELAMAAADLAVSRAGAGSVSELACAGLPSVLVPLAIGNGEQRHNAAELAAVGGAQLVSDAAFPAWAGQHLLDLLLDQDKLQVMAQMAAAVARRDGAERLVDLIEQAADPSDSTIGVMGPTSPAPTETETATRVSRLNQSVWPVLTDWPTARDLDPTTGAVRKRPQPPGIAHQSPGQPASGNKKDASYHLMGAGGIGMMAVAELAVASGWQVSGCDAAGSPGLDHLASLGVNTAVGHDPAHLETVDTVVVSSAIKPTNPELAAAKQAGLRIWHRSQALAALAEGQRLLAVSGTHGKTTTSAMAAVGLQAAGCDPSFAIGAEVLGAGSGARLGQGGIMVIEADESDGSFLNYHPEVAIVTNVEADHLDHYGSTRAVMAAFQRFVRQATCSVVGIDNPRGKRLATWAKDHGQQVISFGVDQAAQVVLTKDKADAVRLVGTAGSTDLDLTITLSAPGWHLRLDAAAALIGAVMLGGDPAAVASGIEGFLGTGRRFETKAEVGSIRVVDDYAHHPTEVQATLTAARQVAANRVLVVFQPHLYSRTKTFASEFAQALALADLVWVLDVYGAREAPSSKVSSRLITAKMDPAKAIYQPKTSAVAAAVAAAAEPGDLIITMGAGNVTELAEPIIQALRLT